MIKSYNQTYQRQPIAIDDLPDDRITDALAMFFYLRKLGDEWCTLADSYVGGVLSDLAFCGHVHLVDAGRIDGLRIVRVQLRKGAA